ncbi:hypothetical protein [Actinomadura chibensis]|uniref:Uncharacterized protein n=1 Tax=Actinomadura chibensis TaxID=392828 RepID=A0A5D0NWI2_9ACTN|nr:hypothetical protein [Actinomadura chibensis]TYB48528.1 hypothetical protein FXF69_04900 [Actinomadura chibensis]
MAAVTAAGMSLSAFAVAVPSASAAPSAHAAPALRSSPRCDPHDVAKVVTKRKYTKVNETDVIVNRSRSTVTRKVHFERTTTLSSSVSGGIGPNFKDFIFREVKAKVNAGIDRTSTVKKGYGRTVKIRKGYKMTAAQGWRMQQAKGYVYHVYSNCRTRTVGYYTLNAPWQTFVTYTTTRL